MTNSSSKNQNSVAPNTLYHLLQCRHVVIFHGNKHTFKRSTAYQCLVTKRR